MHMCGMHHIQSQLPGLGLMHRNGVLQSGLSNVLMGSQGGSEGQ